MNSSFWRFIIGSGSYFKSKQQFVVQSRASDKIETGRSRDEQAASCNLGRS